MTIFIAYLLLHTHVLVAFGTPSQSANDEQPKQLGFLYQICSSLNYSCESLPALCLDCDFSLRCTYGEQVTVKCSPKPTVNCTGNHELLKPLKCGYCHQLNETEAICEKKYGCYDRSVPVTYYMAWCYPPHHELCLGNRAFRRMLPCLPHEDYWQSLMVSGFFGGFGADLFHWGSWKAAICKITTFGGAGVWTVIDFVLFAAGIMPTPQKTSSYRELGYGEPPSIVEPPVVDSISP